MSDMGVGGGRPRAGVVEQRDPAGNAAPAAGLESSATRGAKALVSMPAADRDLVIGQIPGRVDAIADTVIGGALDNRLLGRNKKALVALIQQGANRISGETVQAGSRVADLRAGLTADGGTPQVVAETARALAQIAARGGASPEDFAKLAGKLELLAELQGEKRFAMIANRGLKQKIMQLTNGDLSQLASQVGAELAQLAYGGVRRAAIAEQLA